MAAPKRVRQFFFAWQFQSATVIVMAVLLVSGTNIAQGDNVGENALVLALFGTGYVVLILLFRRMRRQGDV